MKRAIVHAACIVGLVGFGWGVHLAAEYPFPGPLAPQLQEHVVVGPWAWIPSLAGCGGMTLCLALCFAAARGRASWLPLSLVAPALVLALASIGFHVEVGELMADVSDPDARPTDYMAIVWWMAAQGFHVQHVLARGLVWAWLIYVAIALAASCVPVPKPRRGDTLRWAWPLAVLTALAGVIFVYVLAHASVFQRLFYLTDLDPWARLGEAALGLVDPRAIPIQSPFLTSLGILLLMTLALLPLRARVADFVADSTAPPSLDVSRARATAGVAALGACTTLGLTFWTYAAARVMLNTHTAVGAKSAEAKQAMLALWGVHSPFRDYSAGLVVSLALVATAFVVAGPLLVTSIRARRVWALPAALLLLFLLTFAGFRAATLPRVTAELSPRCTEECTELDRIAALMTFSRLQLSTQLIRNRCEFVGVVESDGLTLARVESDRCPDISAQLAIHREEVLVNGIPILPPVAGQSTAPSCDPEMLTRVHAHLEGSAEDARAIAARNPAHPFKGRLLVIPDRSTPSGPLDCLLAAAFEADFHEQHIAVARPGRPFPLFVRTVQIHADPALAPPEDTPLWTLDLSPGEAVLTSPTDETWTAPEAHLLVEDARTVLSRLRGSPMLWVYRSEDLTLEADLQARVALTAPGLFVEAWSMPVGELQEEWVQPARPDHPAVL